MYDLWNVVRLKMKEQGKMFLIPFLVNLFFIPMIIWSTYQRYGLDNETKMQIIKFTQYFTPVLVLTWLLSLFIKYVNETGNDIFFVIRRMKWREVLCSYIIYIVSNTWIFGIYGMFFDGMLLEWIRITIETFLIVSMAYCLIFATKSLAATLVIILIYAFGSVRSMNAFFHVFGYYSWKPASLQELLLKYTLLTVISLILFILGLLGNFNMHKYK